MGNVKRVLFWGNVMAKRDIITMWGSLFTANPYLLWIKFYRVTKLCWCIHIVGHWRRNEIIYGGPVCLILSRISATENLILTHKTQWIGLLFWYLPEAMVNVKDLRLVNWRRII